MMIQMEYCKGESLDKYLLQRNQPKTKGFKGQGGVIDRRENLEIFTQVMNGIAEIHKSRVLHRDLKPDNIFIDINQ